MPATARRVHLDWDEAYEKHGAELTRYEELLESFEKENNLMLTPGAIELIFVPLVETLESGAQPDHRVIAETLRILMKSIAVAPDSRDKMTPRRSAWSVAKAFWKNWCNIPPICGPTDAGQ